MPSTSKLVPEGLRVVELFIERTGVTISLAAAEPSAKCPLCGCDSKRVHSLYSRTITDLSWHGIPVTLRVRTRKFFAPTRGVRGPFSVSGCLKLRLTLERPNA